MHRRELLGILGAGTVGLASLSRDAAGADPADHHHHDKVHEDCLKACGACARACNETAGHCLEQLAEGSGDRKMHARVHELTMDCQAFCVLAATMMERSSDLMQYSCEACAEACRCCAEACDKHPASEMVKACAASCRACENACRAMAKSMRGRNV